MAAAAALRIVSYPPRILQTLSQFWEISFNQRFTFTNDSGLVTS